MVLCPKPQLRDFIKAMDTEKPYVLTSQESNISTTFHVTPMKFNDEENFAMIVFRAIIETHRRDDFMLPPRPVQRSH